MGAAGKKTRYCPDGSPEQKKLMGSSPIKWATDIIGAQIPRVKQITSQAAIGDWNPSASACPAPQPPASGVPQAAISAHNFRNVKNLQAS